MRIYTKEGDQGTTDTKVGKINKDSSLVGFMGELDELIAYFGELNLYMNGRYKYALETIIEDLLNMAKEIKNNNVELISRYNVQWLEENIDTLSNGKTIDKEISPYALNMLAAKVNIARTKVRTVERAYFKAIKETKINENVGMYLNRLSDYLLVFYQVVNVEIKE